MTVEYAVKKYKDAVCNNKNVETSILEDLHTELMRDENLLTAVTKQVQGGEDRPGLLRSLRLTIHQKKRGSAE
jgi:hypothetical protein